MPMPIRFFLRHPAMMEEGVPDQHLRPPAPARPQQAEPPMPHADTDGWLQSVDPDRFARMILRRAGIVPLPPALLLLVYPLTGVSLALVALTVNAQAASAQGPVAQNHASQGQGPLVTALGRARAVIANASVQPRAVAERWPADDAVSRPADRPIERTCDLRALPASPRGPDTAPQRSDPPACRLIIIDMP